MFNLKNTNLYKYLQACQDEFTIVNQIILAIITFVIATTLKIQTFNLHNILKINVRTEILLFFLVAFILVSKLKIFSLFKGYTINGLDQFLIYSFFLEVISLFSVYSNQYRASTIIWIIIATLLAFMYRIGWTQSHTVIGKDISINNRNEVASIDAVTDSDRLGRSFITDDLFYTIKEFYLPQKYTIGIIGKWGSGKSSLIKIVEKKIRDENIENVNFSWFDPWKMDSKEAILSELIKKLCEATNIPFKNYEIQGFINAITKTVLGSNYSSFYESITNYVRKDDYQNSIEKFANKLSTYLQNENQRIVLVVDNLDRISGENAFFIVSTIATITEISNLIVVLTYDEAELLAKFEKISIHSISGNYMDKVVDKLIVIPDPNINVFSQEIYNRISDLFIENEIEFKEDEIQLFCKDIAGYDYTFRDVNRFINSISFNKMRLNSRNQNIANKFYLLDYLVLEFIKSTDIQFYNYLSDNRWRIVSISKKISFRGIFKDNKMSADYVQFFESMSKLGKKKNEIVITQNNRSIKLLRRISPNVDLFLNRAEDGTSYLTNGKGIYFEDYDSQPFLEDEVNRRVYCDLFIDQYFALDFVEDEEIEKYMNLMHSNNKEEIFVFIKELINTNIGMQRKILFTLKNRAKTYSISHRVTLAEVLCTKFNDFKDNDDLTLKSVDLIANVIESLIDGINWKPKEINLESFMMYYKISKNTSQNDEVKKMIDDYIQDYIVKLNVNVLSINNYDPDILDVFSKKISEFDKWLENYLKEFGDSMIKDGGLINLIRSMGLKMVQSPSNSGQYMDATHMRLSDNVMFKIYELLDKSPVYLDPKSEKVVADFGNYYRSTDIKKN